MDALQKLKKRLIHQSWYRGCKETDMLLGRFVRDQQEQLSDDEWHMLEQFMQEDDKDIYRWLTDQTAPPEHVTSMSLYHKLKAYHDA